MTSIARPWSPGEKTFPYDAFRKAAREAGGDGVTRIHPDPGNRDRHVSRDVGEVVRCAP